MPMSLSTLTIHNLRNLNASRHFNLHPRCNLFVGPNGSGKTSILEALYLLCTGHSFRTRETQPLITDGQQQLTIFTRTHDEQTLSIQKSLTGPTLVKLNMQSCHSSSELARFLPCQVFYQDIFQIIDAGPSTRRTLLDWGLFHVKHSYFALWKNYQAVVKQRNALLRQRASKEHFIPWNKQLVDLAYALHDLRSTYFHQWSEQFQHFLQQLTDIPCRILYYKGWDKKESNKNLSIILDEQFPQDIQQQYTHSGAHQADILFDLSSKKAKQLLSRGQQKIVLIALKLAQASLVPNCIYLFDDITAELDMQHVHRIVECLGKINNQLFVTTMDERSLPMLGEHLQHQSFRLQQLQTCHDRFTSTQSITQNSA